MAWLQLLRLGNVFTSLADVAMGWLVTHGTLQPPLLFALLAAASCLLYLSGMVLNDVFDAKEDAREWPSRPIPSGRVSFRAAATAGWAMLCIGMIVAWLAGATTGDWRPAGIIMALAASVVLYDAVLKRTLFAPVAMGACRFLNVLLGMSLGPLTTDGDSLEFRWGTPAALLVALGVGVYVAGVTIFARTDARTSARGQLLAGLAVLLSGMALLATVPTVTENDPPLAVTHNGWYLLWAVLALITSGRCVQAIVEPSPPRVQAAVRHCVMSIIVLDAAVVVGYVGPFWGLAVFTLIFPAVGLAQWIRAT